MDLIYSNKLFLLQENLILGEDDEQANLKFKADFFLLRYLILANKTNIPLDFSSRCNGILTESYFEGKFTNDDLILLIQECLRL